MTKTSFPIKPRGRKPSTGLIGFAAYHIGSTVLRMGYPQPEQTAFVKMQVARMNTMDETEVAGMLLAELPAVIFHRA
jgi:hypothetical protein